MARQEQGRGVAAVLAGALALAACTTAPDTATRAAEATPLPALDPAMQDGTTSERIAALLARQSVLAPGPLREVSDAVLDANSRAAEAEFRAAALRAEAASRNWLPSLGPTVSLTSLGAVAAQMLVDQMIFDNGRRKAERAHSRADVEVAAVTLAEDSNDRVLTALTLYLAAEEARARAVVTAEGVARMERLHANMAERTRAGVSDRADLQVVGQKLAQMRSDLASDREAEATALGELDAMSMRPLGPVAGLSPVGGAAPETVSLDVLRAGAERDRLLAEADMARAGVLPGVGLNAGVTGAGSSGGLTAGASNGVGFGMGANLRAIEAAREAAEAKVGQAAEEAGRRIGQLTGELASLERRAAEAGRIAGQAAANDDLFAQQIAAGQRAVPDAVSVLETRVRAEREAARLAHEVVRQRLRIARHFGALVDGDRI